MTMENQTTQPTNQPVAQLTTSVHRTQLKDLIQKQMGRFVGIDFVKKDGTKRSLNGRLGVSRHLKTGVDADRGDLPYIVVYDVKARGYRSVNMATVGCVRAVNTNYAVIG